MGAERAELAAASHTLLAMLTIQALKVHGVRFIVAPYEADAQMAYLALSGEVYAVVTEDSDLLAYGCPRVRSISRDSGSGCDRATERARDPDVWGNMWCNSLWSLQCHSDLCLLYPRCCSS